MSVSRLPFPAPGLNPVFPDGEAEARVVSFRVTTWRYKFITSVSCEKYQIFHIVSYSRSVNHYYLAGLFILLLNINKLI